MRMMSGVLLLSLVAVAAAFFVAAIPGQESPSAEPADASPAAGDQTIVVGGGCFWCLEPQFEMLKGVRSVEVAYAGGAVAKPTYEMVCTGQTGHAEALKVTYDPKVISADDLLRVFFTIHDPTTLNRQGGDVGTQYRSVVFYSTDAEKERAEKIIREISDAKIWSNPLVTTVEPLVNYTRAEEYHQDYYRKFEKANAAQRARMNSGYCSAVIEPKVRKFREKFASKLR